MNRLNYEPRLDLPNPAARQAKIVLRMTIGMLTWGIVALVVAVLYHRAPWFESPVAGVLLFCGIPLGIFGLAMPLGYASLISDARRIEQCRRDFASGNFLVQWRYSASACEKVQARRMALARQRYQSMMIGATFFGIAALVVLALVEVIGLSDAAALFSMRLVTVLVMAVCGAVMLTHTLIYRRQLGPPQPLSIIGVRGAYANGRWVLWATGSRVLRDVQFDAASARQPARIMLRIYDGSRIVTEEIVVPSGNEDLAVRVAKAIMKHPSSRQGGEINRVAASIYRTLRIIRAFR